MDGLLSTQPASELNTFSFDVGCVIAEYISVVQPNPGSILAVHTYVHVLVMLRNVNLLCLGM